MQDGLGRGWVRTVPVCALVNKTAVGLMHLLLLDPCWCHCQTAVDHQVLQVPVMGQQLLDKVSEDGLGYIAEETAASSGTNSSALFSAVTRGFPAASLPPLITPSAIVPAEMASGSSLDTPNEAEFQPSSQAGGIHALSCKTSEAIDSMVVLAARDTAGEGGYYASAAESQGLASSGRPGPHHYSETALGAAAPLVLTAAADPGGAGEDESLLSSGFCSDAYAMFGPLPQDPLGSGRGASSSALSCLPPRSGASLRRQRTRLPHAEEPGGGREGGDDELSAQPRSVLLREGFDCFVMNC